MTNDKRIRIIIGHFGSGKTEFAVNYAMKLAEKEEDVAICDLDVINPYFRSREKAEIMEDKGIKVISGASGHNANLAVPMVSAAIIGPIRDENCQTVLDVGGDIDGARTLARYRPHFNTENTDIFFVINANRPETQNVKAVAKYIEEMEESINMKVTGLISNTHMLKSTSIEDVVKGIELVNEVSEKLDIPIKYIVALEQVTRQISDEYSDIMFPIKMYMREEWMM